MPEVKNVKIDLNQLRNEIDSRKSELNNKQVALGNVPEGAIRKGGKKQFLNELVHSMERGIKSDAIEAIRAVNETVEVRRGLPQAVAKNVMGGRNQQSRRNNNYQQPQYDEQYDDAPMPQNRQPQVRTGASDWGFNNGNNAPVNYGRGEHDRESMFDQDFGRANEAFDKMMMSGMANNNPMMAKFIQQNQPQYKQQYLNENQGGAPMNEQMENLNEKVERNLDKMVESTLKNVLTNIYTKEKIQEALAEYLESDDFIKVVGKAINEIAKRNKAKQTK